tara:strand:+ start:57 stop:530 length:474 start_codon:yes stop_codon:yes gene_type:complete
MENSKKPTCACSTAKKKETTPKKNGKKMSALNIASGVLLFLFPKCPMCWAAYATFFSFLGIDTVTYNSNWNYILLAIFLMGSFLLLRKHYLNNSWLSMSLYSLGMFVLLTTYFLNFTETFWLYIVLGLIVLSNFSVRNHQKFLEDLKSFLQRKQWCK